MDLRSDIEFEKSSASDRVKVENVKNKLKLLAEALNNDPLLWTSVITFGLKRMFESSDFSVYSELILDAGFAPHEWFIYVRKASKQLSYSIAEKITKQNNLKMDLLNKILNLSMGKNDELIEKEIIDKIKNILLWNEVLIKLDNVCMKTLAFLWMADFLSVFNGILYPESDIEIQENAWNYTQQLMKKDKDNLLEKLDDMIDILENIKIKNEYEDIHITNWGEIFHLPW